MSTPSSSLKALSSRPIPLRVPHGARDDRGEPTQSRRAAEHRRVLAGQSLSVRGKLYLKVNPLLREPLSVLAPQWIDLPARRAALPAGYGDLCVLGFYRDMPSVKVWNGPFLDWRGSDQQRKGEGGRSFERDK